MRTGLRRPLEGLRTSRLENLEPLTLERGGRPDVRRDAAALVSAVLPLLHEAGNPYFDWFFGDPAAARSTLGAWMMRSSSEVALERIVVASSRDEVVGAFLALGGAELVHARQVDVLALVNEASRDPSARAELVERIAATKILFARVAPRDWYLSKVAVVDAHRARGLGRALVEEYLAAGLAAGFRRFRLDVSADNDQAVRIYRSLGFRVEADRAAAGMRYLAMTLDHP